MSASFLLLCLCAIGAAYGAAVAVRRKLPAPWTIGGVLLLSVAGVNGALLVARDGDGRILPGRQLNPDIARRWSESAKDSSFPFPAPVLYLAALLAHVVLWARRPNRAGVFAPLPSTLLFGLLYAYGGAEKTTVHRGAGPAETAYLTISSTSGGCHLVIASGAEDATFLRVRVAHEAGSPPPQPELRWTVDGRVLVLTVRRERLLAIPPEGEPVGWLPSTGNAWPREDPSTEPADAMRVRSEARLQVSQLVTEHGGLR